jgi:hypothetical protein
VHFRLWAPHGKITNIKSSAQPPLLQIFPCQGVGFVGEGASKEIEVVERVCGGGRGGARGVRQQRVNGGGHGGARY